jgi:hypothetical protein
MRCDCVSTARSFPTKVLKNGHIFCNNLLLSRYNLTIVKLEDTLITSSEDNELSLFEI